jgi:Zn-dependent protease with chaperone function
LSALYCANCGVEVYTLSVCDKCCWDPQVPQPIMERFVNDRGASVPRDRQGGLDAMIEYPGERTSLLLSIAVLALAMVVVGTATLGVSLLLVAMAILSIPVQEARSRAAFIRASDSHYPELARLAKVAAFRLGVTLPEVYVDQQVVPNAYTSGFWRKHWIVVHSCLLDLCTPGELLFVIGHEMGHIKRQHTSWLTFTSARPALRLPLIRELLTVIFNSWLQRAEYSADRAGLLACRDAVIATSALIRIQFWNKPANIDALEATWKSLTDDPAVRFTELLDDHPALHSRVHHLKRFASVLRTREVL